MNDPQQNPIPPSIDRRYLQTAETFKRDPAERPGHDTIDGIATWIVGPARQIASGSQVFDEFAWRMLATGLPLLRVTLHARVLHPQFLGMTLQWWRTTGQTTLVLIAHEILETVRYESNPVMRVSLGGETLRRNLEVADDALDFPILRELKAEGGTDYFALPVPAALGSNYMVTYVADRAGGFTAAEIADLTRVSHLLAVVSDMHSQRALARNLLNAYLGAKTGPRVLEGQIRRGTGEALTAVLWSSDLRAFTERSDRLPGDRMVAILNAVFDTQAKVIHAHGGEILKFIGDGMLAIFPIDGSDTRVKAARNALAAAFETVAAVQGLTDDPAMKDEPPLDIVVALHVGTAIYGNVGAADRLDFTVIGPAVNLVSRVEAVGKTLNLPIIVSDDFAQAYAAPLPSVGLHRLRGLATAHELFAPALVQQPGT